MGLAQTVFQVRLLYAATLPLSITSSLFWRRNIGSAWLHLQKE